jgi:hypothetical protein
MLFLPSSFHHHKPNHVSFPPFHPNPHTFRSHLMYQHSIIVIPTHKTSQARHEALMASRSLKIQSWASASNSSEKHQLEATRKSYYGRWPSWDINFDLNERIRGPHSRLYDMYYLLKGGRIKMVRQPLAKPSLQRISFRSNFELCSIIFACLYASLFYIQKGSHRRSISRIAFTPQRPFFQGEIW